MVCIYSICYRTQYSQLLIIAYSTHNCPPQCQVVLRWILLLYPPALTLLSWAGTHQAHCRGTASSLATWFTLWLKVGDKLTTVLKVPITTWLRCHIPHTMFWWQQRLWMERDHLVRWPQWGLWKMVCITCNLMAYSTISAILCTHNYNVCHWNGPKSSLFMCAYATFSSLSATPQSAKSATQLHHTASLMAATIEPVPERYHPRVQDKYHWKWDQEEFPTHFNTYIHYHSTPAPILPIQLLSCSIYS